MNYPEIKLIGSVKAGFPSPAEDFCETKLNIHSHLVAKPETTFFVRASGDSMIGAGILAEDILVVDRSRTPIRGDIIIAFINGEFTVKRFNKKSKEIILEPENPNYPPIILKSEDDFIVWGVVTGVVRKLL